MDTAAQFEDRVVRAICTQMRERKMNYFGNETTTIRWDDSAGCYNIGVSKLPGQEHDRPRPAIEVLLEVLSPIWLSHGFVDPFALVLNMDHPNKGPFVVDQSLPAWEIRLSCFRQAKGWREGLPKKATILPFKRQA